MCTIRYACTHNIGYVYIAVNVREFMHVNVCIASFVTRSTPESETRVAEVPFALL